MQRKKFKKTLTVKGVVFYEKHLQILKTLLPDSYKPLSSTELKVLACFLFLEQKLNTPPFTMDNRRNVRNRFNMSHSGISHHLDSLTTKGYITGKSQEDSIYQFCKTSFENSSYQIELLIDADGNK